MTAGFNSVPYTLWTRQLMQNACNFMCIPGLMMENWAKMK